MARKLPLRPSSKVTQARAENNEYIQKVANVLQQQLSDVRARPPSSMVDNAKSKITSQGDTSGLVSPSLHKSVSQ